MGRALAYGARELAYARPFAERLVDDMNFVAWVLAQTKFAIHARNVRLLHKEMAARRKAEFWWRSHYTEKCRCPGCCGQETDILAVFEAAAGQRFALHIEVKQPTDKFSNPGQAAAYPVRAQCWSADGKNPRSVLEHTDAATVLLCSTDKLEEYAPYLQHFGSVITFEDLHRLFNYEPGI
jgi:hypothetical protein